jgi:hypothetical protein
VRLTKSRSVVTAKKRAQTAVANMVRAGASRLGYAFAIRGYALRLMVFFRLCHRFIAAKYHSGPCWPRRGLNRGRILGGFCGLRNASAPHYRSL